MQNIQSNAIICYCRLLTSELTTYYLRIDQIKCCKLNTTWIDTHMDKSEHLYSALYGIQTTLKMNNMNKKLTSKLLITLFRRVVGTKMQNETFVTKHISRSLGSYVKKT